MSKDNVSKDERRCFRCGQSHADTFACPSDPLTSKERTITLERARASAAIYRQVVYPSPTQYTLVLLDDEIDRQRAEIERLTRAHSEISAQRDQVLREVAGWPGAYQALAEERDRLRACLNDACLSLSVHGEQPPTQWLAALQASSPGTAPDAVIGDAEAGHFPVETSGKPILCELCGATEPNTHGGHCPTNWKEPGRDGRLHHHLCQHIVTGRLQPCDCGAAWRTPENGDGERL